MGIRNWLHNTTTVIAQRLEPKAAPVQTRWRVFKAPPVAVRHFDAADRNRLTEDWRTNTVNINSVLRMQLPVMVARSRNLARNDDYFRQFLRLCANNVVGATGIRMQAKVRKADGRPDSKVNNTIEESWQDWGQRENCSVTERNNWRGVQNLALRTMLVDGECVIREIYDDSEYGYRLQFIPTDWLDITFNDDSPGKNRIVMSVEIDIYGKPVAYYLTPPRNDFFAGVPDSFSPTNVKRNDRMRIPADEIHHLFFRFEENQMRGIPWAVSSMLRLRMLGAYEDAAVINQRVSASKMGFLQTPDTEELDPNTVTDDPDALNTDLTDEVQAGMLKTLPPGVTFAEFNPNDPKIGFGEFVKGILRGVWSGMGISYNTGASDAESVTFGTLRQMVLNDRDFYRDMQVSLTEQLCSPIYKKWALLLSGTSALPVAYSKIRKFNAIVWRGRGWQWVDPLKDAQAAEIEINLGITTRTELAEERGRDFEETVDQLALEQELADANEVNIYGIKSAINPNDPANDPESAAANGKSAKSGS